LTDDPRVRRWLGALVATPGLTAVESERDAWQLHVEDALVALPLLCEGPVVDVGAGGGSPGIPLAASRPDLQFDLLETSRRKCAFLERWAAAFPNVAVVCLRAEEHARGRGRDAYAVALARALAPQPVAVEWCLPLVRPGGSLVLFASAPVGGLAGVAATLGAELAESVPVPGSNTRSLIVFRKVAPTPARYPRRPGIARKRPLGDLDSPRR
jgi:16S rRNA (guanine527-N7)-methyltransferase